MEIGKSFGQVLRGLREERKLTQEQIAERANCDRVFISNLETGARLPSLQMVFAIAEALNMNPSELIREVEGQSKYKR